MPFSLLFDSKYKWFNRVDKNIRFHGIGDNESLLKIYEKIKNSGSNDNLSVRNTLSSLRGNFSGIIDTVDLIVAFVDVIRSYPIFYSIVNDHLYISNSARMLKVESGNKDIDKNALLEFTMTGYVTGDQTIYKNLNQLESGTILIWNKKEKKLDINSYYTFHPKGSSIKSENTLLEGLNDILDKVFTNMIEKINGDPVWVPLSGGLDSRLVVTKLLSLGYDNIKTFSYGPKSNYEAMTAKMISEIVDVPWMHIRSNRSNLNKLFNNSHRIKYWKFSDGLSSIPAMNDYESIYIMKKSGILPENAVLINGQTGDFISGGHIPDTIIMGDFTASSLVKYIIKKHYSVWNHLNTRNNHNIIENRILSVLNINKNAIMSKEEITACYETWEWRNRQCKFVVNGQRIYDYFNLKWELPLWSIDLLKFWETVPLDLRINQKLYKNYLHTFNYKDVFKNTVSENRRWPGSMGLIIRWVLRALKLVNIDGQFIKKYFSYFGHYSDQYAYFGFNYFFKNIKNAVTPPQARGTVGLRLKYWMEENIELLNNKSYL